MLRRKLPDEIFVGRRVLPNSLFRRDDVASYLANLHWALNETVAELGSGGSVDLFDLTRRIGHRMGLASWAGPGSAEGDAFERLVSAFDTLDGSDAFVHPDAMAAVAASDKRAERVGVGRGGRGRGDSGAPAGLRGRRATPLFSAESWRPGRRSRGADRIRGIGLDVALIHIASMSNLMAALGWAMVDLLEHPARTGRRGRRRRRTGATLRLGEHAAGATLDHVAGGAGSGRPRHRRRDVSGACRLDHRHAVAAAEHLGRTRPGALGSRPLAPAPACRTGWRCRRRCW